MIVQKVENTEEIFRHWLEDTVTGEKSGKAGYTGFVHLNGHVGFTAFYSDKEGVLPSDEFCKMAATGILDEPEPEPVPQEKIASVKQVLIKAREKIADPKNWLKGAAARNSSWQVVPSGDKDATCFCAVGAIDNVLILEAGLQDMGGLPRLARAALQEETPCNLPVSTYNDARDTTHKDILDVFDRAIAKA